MTTGCVPGAWGLTPYGVVPWAGLSPALIGGPLPYTNEFDIYCVGACGDMAFFTSYNSVEETIQGNQIGYDPIFSDFVITSGGVSSDQTASIYVDTAVTSQATLEFTFKSTDLPGDFTDLKNSHFFVGVVDQQGASAGLFFSLLGLAYTGSILHDPLTNELVLNSTVQLLPGSLNLVSEGTYYTVRIVVDASTSTIFIYVTETSQVPITGHQLKFILPAIASSACVVALSDGTYLSVKGTASAPVSVQLNSLCLGKGLIIPNLPPIADAGKDQATRTCTIARLDGSASFDPEGANLQYKWRLTDGPLESSFVLPGDDGRTFGVGFTNKLHSVAAADYNASPGIESGDVLLFEGDAHTVVLTGTDVNGFFVQVESYALPAGLTAKSFRILRQSSISGRTQEKCTFYPDAPGLYKFDLTVFDGGLYSLPTNVVLNVLESAVPRGCAPDLHFLWNYLSDFWRLVENTDQLETFWGALAQVTATELLTLWQHEYSKSLRDVQRTFQRRWLHYDLAINEPLVEQTTVQTLYGGVQSATLPANGLAVVGSELLLLSPLFDDTTIRFVGGSGPLSTAVITAQLRKQLQLVDKRFVVETLVSPTTPNAYRVSVRAPFPFLLKEPTSGVPPVGLFSLPALNDLPRGTGGAAIGVSTYKVDKPLTGMGVREGDYLIVNGESYRIHRVVSGPTDTWKDQRLVVEGLPLAPAGSWVICRSTTSSFLDFYNSLCSDGDVAFYEVVDKETNELTYISERVLSASNDGGTKLLTEHAAIAAYLSQPSKFFVYFHSVYRRKRMPVDELVVEVPTLQEKIFNSPENAVLRQNIDFYKARYRGKTCLEFVAGELNAPDVWEGQLPPRRMWAETTHIDNRPVIEQNFGIQASFLLDDLAQIGSNTDYLSVVRGLWYSYFNGPTLYNLRVGTQILLGLPFAEESGTIVEIRDDFSPTQGRILVQDSDSQAIVRAYNYPRSLSLETNPVTEAVYAVGDTVTQFSPLVSGVEVLDYIKDAKWFEGYLSQGSFFEVEKFFKFLVRVDSAAFSLPTLLFVREFILRIKPTYTFPLFVVLKKVKTATVDTTDEVFYDGKLTLNDGPCGFGISSFDDPNTSGGGWQGQYDSGKGYTPIYPVPYLPVNWGFDVGYLCPEDVIIGKLCTTFLAPTVPSIDGIFAFDSAVYTDELSIFEQAGLTVIPSISAPIYIGPSSVTVATPLGVNQVDLELSFAGVTFSSLALNVYVEVNNVVVQTIPFTVLAGTLTYTTLLPLSPVLSLAPGDVVRLIISAQGVSDYTGLPVCAISAVIGAAVPWNFDDPLPAGTYCAYKQM